MSTDDLPLEEALSPPLQTPLDPTYLRTCEACTNRLSPGKFAQLSCSDYYCSDCLTKLFESAIKDETMFPPRCCGTEIRLRRAADHLPRVLVKEFKEREVELRTKDRTYCWRPYCSTFIAPHSIHNSQAICQKCRAVTCSRCKNAWHFGPCIEGDDAAFFELVRSKKIKKCPGCKRMVEKNGGCNHVV